MPWYKTLVFKIYNTDLGQVRGVGMRFLTILSSLIIGISFAANAKIKTEVVEYKDGDTVLEGFLAYDDANKKSRPAVMIVHDWMGLGNNTKEKAQEIAKMGYVAFALDIYGKGVRPKDAQEAGKLAGYYKDNRNILRSRAQAGYDVIKNHKLVKAEKSVAIGYCFGGTTVLEMARAGLPLNGVVSFHGGLSTPKLEDAKNIKAKVLVLHGAIDPYVPATEVTTFEKEMNDANIEYTLIKYSGAVHSFTHKDAGTDITKGAAYNERADKQSWREFSAFMSEYAPLK